MKPILELASFLLLYRERIYMTQQLSIFNDHVYVPDIRSEKQENRSISYDVGVKIGGAMKDIAAQRKSFLEIPSLDSLQAIEEEDVATAAELVNRDTFFGWFSLEACKERGLEPSVAKALQLLIHRIPKSPADTREAREKYTAACLFVSKNLHAIDSFSEFKSMETIISRLFSYEGYSKDYILRSINSYEDSLIYESEQEIIDCLKRNIKEKQQILQRIDEANKYHLSILGKSFRNFFRNLASRKSAYETISSVSSWDDLLKSKTGAKKKEERKPVWERQLPERPDRKGGRVVYMEKPEEFALKFGFKGVEFGNYVEDQTGRDHLFRAAEALTDLADILQVPVQALSLQGELSFAFGSRGRGKAMGHFEPAKRVINLTKKRGSLGILAHEFFHALDNHLYRISHDFLNGKVGYVTKDSLGENLPIPAQTAIHDFVASLTEGESIAYIDVSGRKGTYKLYSSFRARYERNNGDLQAFMDEAMADFDSGVDRILQNYMRVSPGQYKAAEQKYERKRKRELKANAEALAQYHEEVTGMVVTQIPYTTDRTQFYQTGINLDKGKIGAYWSSTVELAARAFEGYVFDELSKREWVSDYLVCGVRDELFPQGDEKERINQSIEKMITAIRPII